MYENIIQLRPYFYSLREINNNVSLDIKIPVGWDYLEIIKEFYPNLEVKVQDKNEKVILLSIISVINSKDGYDTIFTCAYNVIKYNKEREEKEKLFEEKIKELHEIFKRESLEKLKNINFIQNYGQENTTGVGVVEQRDEEGRDGGGESQETID